MASKKIEMNDEMIMKLADKIESMKNQFPVDFSGMGIWKKEPVDFITFCRDWLREPLFDGPQEDFSTDVIGRPGPNGPWDTFKRVILLAWGKGSGKGSLSAKLLVYAGYLLLSMRDPRGFFKIGRTAPIHLINISYNSMQAKTVFFQGYLVPTVLNTINPETGKNFFGEHGVDLRVNEGDILSNVIHFERPLGENEGGITAVSLAGDRGTSEGYSPLIIFVDELSAMQSPEKAEALVDDLEKSANSRFGSFYKLIIASFKRGRNCLMSLRVSEAIEKKLPDTYVSIAATWVVNKLKRKEDFNSMFEKNPVKAARSFEFREVDGVDDAVFFKLADRLENAFLAPNYNPIMGDIITCPSDGLSRLQFKPFFKPKSQAIYNIHVDLAKGTARDRAGIVMTHKEGMESITPEQLDKYISGELEDVQFKIKADLILQITASKGLGEIILDDVRKFIMLIVSFGFRVEVTLDGYQSLDFIQQMNAKGIKAELLSVDRDKKCYESLQSLIYRANLDLYDHPILKRELKELEESTDGRKIDHPQYSIHRAKYEDGLNFGSKDISDALSGSCYKSILADSPRIPLRPELKPQEYYGNGKNADWEDEMEFENENTGGLIDVSNNNGRNKGSFYGRLYPI